MPWDFAIGLFLAPAGAAKFDLRKRAASAAIAAMPLSVVHVLRCGFMDALHTLELSRTVSECPYNGNGQHWHLDVGEQHVSDAAWSLPHPLPEGVTAAEHVSFYPDKVTVTVDGVRLE